MTCNKVYMPTCATDGKPIDTHPSLRTSIHYCILINTPQHGFLKTRSCLTNFLCFFEEITKWVDDGSPVDVVYLDFKKSFDKVPHQRLLLKLNAHGIGNYIINWIEKWLTHRDREL